MKRFLIRISLFSFFSLLIYFVMIFIWGSLFNVRIHKNVNFKQGSNGHLFSRLREVEKYINVDILFVGSSHAYRNFDPRIFKKHDINIFNLGSSSQTPIQTQLLLERYLSKLKPKLLVYEVYPATFESDAVESALDFISNSPFDLDLISMAFKVNHIKVYNTLIYRLMGDLFGVNKNFKEKIFRGKDKYIPGGYVERDDTQKVDLNYQKKKWNLKEKSKNEFNKILFDLKKASVKTILIQTPVKKKFYNSYLNNSEIDNYFRSKGVYINFNKNSELIDSLHFYDEHHLNKTGVKIFNELFIKKIREMKYYDR